MKEQRSLIQNNFEIVEEKNIKSTKIYLKNIDINPESYESKILGEENIENVYKFQIAYDNEERNLVYDVGGSIGLDEYLKSNRLGKIDLCDIVMAIDEVLLSIENYLVSENSISLDLKLIRVKRIDDRLKLKFIVIPNYKSDFSYELSKLLIRTLRFIDIDDKEALNLAYGLFVRSSKENYLISDLLELVDKVQMKSDTNSTEYESDEFKNYEEMMAYENEEKQYNIEDYDYMLEEEQMNENRVLDNRSFEEQKKGIYIDDDTKEFLEDEIYEDFDKADKKIIKFDKDARKSRKKRKLNAHINMGYICSIFAPIVLIVVPFVYFIINGKEAFIKNIAFILVFEVLVVTILIARKIKGYRVNSV